MSHSLTRRMEGARKRSRKLLAQLAVAHEAIADLRKLIDAIGQQRNEALAKREILEGICQARALRDQGLVRKVKRR